MSNLLIKISFLFIFGIGLSIPAEAFPTQFIVDHDQSSVTYLSFGCDASGFCGPTSANVHFAGTFNMVLKDTFGTDQLINFEDDHFVYDSPVGPYGLPLAAINSVLNGSTIFGNNNFCTHEHYYDPLCSFSSSGFEVNALGTFDGQNLIYSGSVNNSFAGISTFTLHATPVPEPASLLLFGSALSGALFFKRRRAK
jgi:hypothetical protein